MSASFEVLRPDGTTAVSSIYKHYRFVKKMRGAGNFWDTSGQQYSDFVLVAFKTLHPSTSTNRFSKGAHNMWGTLTPPPSNATLSFYAAITSDVYIFDITPAENQNGAGIQVRNPAGEVTFDSNYKYMRIIDVITQGFPNMTVSMPIHKTYPGHSIACIPIKEASYARGSQHYGDEYYGATWEYAHQDSFYVDYEESVYEWDGQNFSVRSPEYMCLIIDVAHIDAA